MPKRIAYTFEYIKSVASQFPTRKEFCKKKRRLYEYAKKMGWLDEVSPLTEIFKKQRPQGYYNYKTCSEDALKCDDKETFRKKYPQAYKVSQKNGWLQEICKHMKCEGRKDLRHVYVFEFNDKHAYVGLTCDLNRREYEHMGKSKNSSVKEHIEKTNNPFVFKVITDKPLNVIEVGKLENHLMDTYKQNGWTLLNKMRGGGIGGYTTKWSVSRIKAKAKLCKTRSEFNKKYPGGYDAARKQGILYTIFPQPKKESKPRGFYTYEVCGELSKPFTKRHHFCKAYPAAYKIIKEMGWDELLSHMEYGYGHFNKKWDYKTCKEEASKYKTRTAFSDGNQSAYKVSQKNGWLDEFFPKNIRKP